MSASDVQTEILGPMQRLFYSPRKMEPEDEQAALREYVAALSGFDRPDLRSAWSWVRDNHAKISWPIPSAFVLAAARAKRDRTPAQSFGSREKAERNGRWESWKAVSRSRLAYEAVKSEVAWALKHAILYDGKTTDQISIRELASAKRQAQRTADLIKSGDPVEFKGRMLRFSEENAAVALRMWAVLLERETETRNEIASAR